ncbi:Neural-cadherin Cadherin-N [Channa argus]|uniref:Neural-cadherin Cadherin-N n=1 Tax=Channa argus TaxID=215402 RepID=A0A6G1P9Z9_CHAAH|nr:Neural-cadherin Cadherin-N [Channa argus]
MKTDFLNLQLTANEKTAGAEKIANHKHVYKGIYKVNVHPICLCSTNTSSAADKLIESGLSLPMAGAPSIQYSALADKPGLTMADSVGLIDGLYRFTFETLVCICDILYKVKSPQREVVLGVDSATRHRTFQQENRVTQRETRPEWYLIRVELTVTDVNDNVPEWNMVPAPYFAVVSPDATAGSLVYKLHAQDGDEGNNGEVEYFLSDDRQRSVIKLESAKLLALFAGGDGRFEVDRKSGQVRTTTLPLQQDKEYLLTVVAADRLGSRSAPAVISVVAGARPPQFINASFTIAIPENTPEGQPFLVTPAMSFQKRPISYSLLINPSSLFAITAETGEISLTRPIDYESDQHRYLLLVRVVIVDENDCVPEFLQSIYSKDGVQETVTTATSLLQVSANDCDSEENAELTYYTLSQDFTISPHGTIFPAGLLDYERPNHLYEFVVMAIDKGEVPRTGTATVRIRMANVNDEAPEFSQHVYRTFVSEDAGPNTLVATVLAKDPDGDGITYKITSGNEEGNFVIDSQKDTHTDTQSTDIAALQTLCPQYGSYVSDTSLLLRLKGLIRLRSSPPPRLQGIQYVINVTATDDNASGGPQALSSTAQVIVGVDDVNNNKPVFEKCQQYRESTSVLENQPAGTFVLQVHAVDADEGSNGRVTYGFMHKDSTVPAFSIHPDTGVIVTARKFDRERQREYAVTVTATDQAADPLIGICQLNILILDQNDNSPKFENIRYEYFLREDTMIGTSFLRVAAHDDDFGTNAAITYSMSGEEPEYFKVNPLTGWVYVNQPISQRTYITREIVATDGGNRSSSVELAVTITNVKNQPPQWEKDSYNVVIQENTVRDTPIVVHSGGVVVTIKATSPLGDPRVTYNLEDGLVPETNMPVRFYLTPNREDGSASILVAEPLDYETTRNFMLRVRAQNVAAVPLGAFTTVYVNVTDVNDNVPFFTSSIYEASVTEGAESGTLVLQVSANDLDLGLNGKISYSLLEDRSGDYQYFRIDPELGFIYTQTVFDRETKSSYLLEVQSVDSWESARPSKHGQPNSDTAYVRVFISDVNDNKPAFSQAAYEVDVDEDADVGFAILTVSANDGDEGGNAKLRYQITSGNTGGVFDVEPEVGTIFIAQPLDYEQNKRYKLHVLASDGKWEDYTTVTVNVVNKNDEAPVFTENEYYGRVTEELDGSPVFVLQVTASDPDKDADQEALRYSLHGQGAESEFIIDEVTGKIYAQRTLDREERAVWRFVVLATDEGGEGLTGFSDVIINVWDINDNVPIFTCAPSCHGDVPENSVVGTSVMEMTATDLDDSAVGQNAVLSYRIVGSLDATNIEIGRVPTFSEMFTINPTTGTITVAMGGLDREQVESYLLVVEARDGGGMTGTATATIQIKDVNDHAPRFTDHSCLARISENAEPNAEVLELAAEDRDTGENAQLTFSVVAGDQEQKFYMVSHKQEQRGTLKLKKRLDYERHSEQRFNLTLKVEDLDFSSLLQCVVEVEDYNDHAPVFIPHFLSLAPLPEDVAVGTSVARLVASDSDSGQNRDITYSLAEESDPEGLFTIDQSGVLSVTRPLDRERISQHILVIIATDHGVPPLTGSATVQLPLLDVNDNGPEFEAVYSPIVFENVAGPQVVRLNQTSTLLRAVDLDSPENGPPFQFNVPPEFLHSNDFCLQDNLNGTATLTALRMFDRERQKEFLIPIIMSDSGHPVAKTVTSTLTVTIGDQNDHAHVGGDKKIFINSHRGRMPTTVLGKVYSPDPDDWDNKTYIFEGHVPSYFILNKRTGFLIIKENAPPGTYQFQVRVSDGVWPDAVSTVTVHVRELRDEAIYNSGSLRLADITGKEFIELRGKQRSRYELLVDFLSEMLSVPPDDVNVFSLIDVKERMLDVRFAVHGGPSFLQPEKMHGYLAAHKQKHIPNPRRDENDAVTYRGTNSIPSTGDLLPVAVSVGYWRFLRRQIVPIGSSFGLMSMPQVTESNADAPGLLINYAFKLRASVTDKNRGGRHNIALLPVKLQSFLQVSVFQVRIDECPSSECSKASGCTNVLNVRDTPTVVDCGTMSLVSVTVESTAVCSCSGRDQSHQPCAAYPRNPCFNGGICVDTQHGYSNFNSSGCRIHLLVSVSKLNYSASTISTGYAQAQKNGKMKIMQASLSRTEKGLNKCSLPCNVDVGATAIDTRMALQYQAHVEKLENLNVMMKLRVNSHTCTGSTIKLKFPSVLFILSLYSRMRCQCPAQFEGPECQQSKHSFHGNGYAWFPPMTPCFESHVSLEFITDVVDGLLLYSGPLAQLQAWDHEDFMAIELIDGTPTLKINHGSGTVVLQLPGNVNVADRRWHRLDVHSNSKEVRFTLDRCSGAAVKETEGLGSWLTTQDHSSCEVTGVTPNTDRYLNMSQVLQLGGVNEDIPYIYPQLQHKHFTGCIRNLIVDSKLYDLGSPADSQSSSPGCLTTDSSCVNMGYPSCGHRGRCHGEWGSFSCQCVPGYTGRQCEEARLLDSRTHIGLIRVSGRTLIDALHSLNQVYRYCNTNINLNLTLKVECIFQGLLCVFYNLGDGDYNLTLPTYRLDNGEWHEVFLDRHDNEMMLQLDGGGGQREVTGSRGRSREIIIDHTVVMLGKTISSRTNKSFQGCMRDLRLNGRYMPMDSQPRDGVSQVSVQGLSLGCSSDSCKKNQCSPPFTCVDLWRVHECRYIHKPTRAECNCTVERIRGLDFRVHTRHFDIKGPLLQKRLRHSHTQRSSLSICSHAINSCSHIDTCDFNNPQDVNDSKGSHFRQTLLNVDSVGLRLNWLKDRNGCINDAYGRVDQPSPLSVSTAVLLLGIFLYTRWRSYKGLKEGVYHVSAHHDGQDLARYLCEIIRDADQHPDTGPFDSLQGDPQTDESVPLKKSPSLCAPSTLDYDSADVIKPASQVKAFRRVLTKEFKRLGNKEIGVDVRTAGGRKYLLCCSASHTLLLKHTKCGSCEEPYQQTTARWNTNYVKRLSKVTAR